MDFQSLPWWGQFLVFLVIGLIIFLIFYFSVYDKNQKRIANLRVEIEKVETEIRRAEQKEDKLPQIQAEIEEKQAVLEKLKEIYDVKAVRSYVLAVLPHTYKLARE